MMYFLPEYGVVKKARSCQINTIKRVIVDKWVIYRSVKKKCRSSLLILCLRLGEILVRVNINYLIYHFLKILRKYLSKIDTNKTLKNWFPLKKYMYVLDLNFIPIGWFKLNVKCMYASKFEHMGLMCVNGIDGSSISGVLVVNLVI